MTSRFASVPALLLEFCALLLLLGLQAGCVAGPPPGDEEQGPPVEGGSGGDPFWSGDGDGDGDGDEGDGDTGDGDNSGSGGKPSSPDLFPDEGETFLFIGQDINSIVDYAESIGEPPGVVGYTSLQHLEGLDTLDDHGGGPNHMHGLAARYPEAKIALGLYLVDYLDEVNAGQADENIDELAGILKLYERPVLLRIGYEFDAGWTHYHPSEYIAAYRRIVDRMRAEDADNVAFVWQSAALCAGRYGNFALSAWYPGDEYVDWLGLSYFTQSSCGFGPVYEVVELARDYGKPVFIAEATPQGYDLDELTFSYDGAGYASRSAEAVWSEWFQPFFSFADQNADVVRAVTYINADWNSQGLWGPPYAMGYWGDTRVQVNDTICASWENAIESRGWSDFP